MSQLPTLIADLALILICAGVMTLLFKKLKQPLVLGYVKPEYSKVGTEICIDMRGRKLKAVVVKPPFRK